MRTIAEDTAKDILDSVEDKLNKILTEKNEPHKLWNRCPIKKRIEERKNGKTFKLEDHIRAMVYSMLSSNKTWEDVSKNADPETGYIPEIDLIFNNYKRNHLEEHQFTSRELKMFREKQQNALRANIEKLLSIEDIDTYYQKFIDIDGSLKTLIIALSTVGSPIKLEQMGVPLVCEYLRNVGHDIPKPDRHIIRILGSDYLDFHNEEITSYEKKVWEAFDRVTDLADRAERTPAETDYILWSYCAREYGEICTKKNAKCGICVAKEHCNHYKK